jgi:KaiC/GvpD/RAD55 family RecA-like ATPase
MAQDLKGRLESKLKEYLTPDENHLMSLISIETRKDKLVFRMPLDVISLEDVWTKVKQASLETKIECIRSGMYATVSDLDDVLGDVKWLWKDWIPKGFVSLVVGDPGIGKSMLLLSIIKFITSGEDYPTSENNEKPSNVLWIDTEASQQLLRMRVKKMAVDPGQLYIPVIDGDILGQVDVMNMDHRAVILDMIDSIQPAIIVLDSLGGSHTRGENKFEEIAPILKFFAMIARDKNIGVLMTHHLNKGSPGDTSEVDLYRIRGSTAIPQFCRSIMAMEKLKEDEIRFRMIKSNLSRLAKPLAIVPVVDNDGDIVQIIFKEYIPPTPKRSKTELCANWIVEYMKNNPSDSGLRLRDLTEIMEGEGYTRGNIYAARTMLAERILVTGTGKEAYWHYVNNNQPDTNSINQIIKAKKNGSNHDGKE